MVAKAVSIIDLVNEISHKLFIFPWHFWSTDEMMKLFKGCYVQTHQMKNKPIKEGFNIFAICDASTSCYHVFFHPEVWESFGYSFRKHIGIGRQSSSVWQVTLCHCNGQLLCFIHSHQRSLWVQHRCGWHWSCKNDLQQSSRM